MLRTSFVAVVVACFVALGLADAAPRSRTTTDRHRTAALAELDKEALKGLIETHDGDTRILWDKDADGMARYRYIFNKEVKGRTHRFLVLCVPAKDQVVILATVSPQLTPIQVLLVKERLRRYNPLGRPGNELPGLALSEEDTLIVFTVLKWKVSLKDFETSLDRVLECIAQTEPIWGDLR